MITYFLESSIPAIIAESSENDQKKHNFDHIRFDHDNILGGSCYIIRTYFCQVVVYINIEWVYSSHKLFQARILRLMRVV